MSQKLFNVDQAVAADVDRAVSQLFANGQDTVVLNREAAQTALTDVAVLSFNGCLSELEDFVKAFQLLPSHQDYPVKYQ